MTVGLLLPWLMALTMSADKVSAFDQDYLVYQNLKHELQAKYSSAEFLISNWKRLAELKHSHVMQPLQPLTKTGIIEVVPEGVVYEDIHTFEGRSGQGVVIELTSDHDPVYLLLVNSNYEEIAQIRGDANSDLSLTLSLPETDTYTVLTSASFVEEVGYTLHIRSAIAEEVRIAELQREVVDLHAQGIYSSTIPMIEEIAALEERTLGSSHLNYAISLKKLSFTHGVLGDHSKAESFLIKALEIQRQNLGENHLIVADTLQQLALTYLALGRTDKAETLLLKVLNIKKEKLSIDDSSYLRTLHEIGFLYYTQNRLSEAENIYLRLLNIFDQGEASSYPTSSRLAVLNNLALVYYSQLRYDEAQDIYRRILDIDPEYEAAIYNQGLIFHKEGQYDDAIEQYREAIRLIVNRRDNEAPILGSMLRELSLSSWAQGEYDKALNLLERALYLDARFIQLNILTGTDQQKREFLDKNKRILNQTVSLYLDGMPESPEAAKLAFQAILQFKGKVLDLVSVNRQQVGVSFTENEQHLLEQLESIYSQIANLTYQDTENLSLEAHDVQVIDLETDAQELEEQLALTSAGLHVEFNADLFEEIKKVIPDSSVLVEILKYDPTAAESSILDRFLEDSRYVAFIMLPSGYIKGVDLGSANLIEKHIKHYRYALNTQKEDIKEVARELDKFLMEPLREYLDNKTHILLSPDSQLNLIPFEALVDENDRYLLERYTFTYLNSGRDLLKFQTTESNAQISQAPVIVANPDYNYSEEIEASKDNTASGSSLQSEHHFVDSNGRRSVDLSELYFSSLDGTELEADNIISLIPEFSLLEGAQATENAIKQVQNPKILHLATHGFFLPDIECYPSGDTRRSLGSDDRASILLQPVFADQAPDCQPTPSNSENPLLRSGLAFAGFNLRKSGSEDGVLTALEVMGLDLSATELVVLSACETGLGDVSNGEGVYGLRRAFTIAGAQSQLISLWRVADYETSLLMTLFYKNLNHGMGRSEAFRAAQLEMMQQPEYIHPYYWASFISSGDWTPLNFYF
ncbi:MAG: CHAT domain-containing protein [Cyanobacteria bacterium P01_D01_bin.156]